MLNIKDLTESKELARDEMSAVRGGNSGYGYGYDYGFGYGFGYPGGSVSESFQDNDLVSANIGQQMINDIDAAFATVHNTPKQNANINIYA